jgi:hypothetical protein
VVEVQQLLISVVTTERWKRRRRQLGETGRFVVGGGGELLGKETAGGEPERRRRSCKGGTEIESAQAVLQPTSAKQPVWRSKRYEEGRERSKKLTLVV